MHSFMEVTTLGSFVAGYFDAYSDRRALLDEQAESLDWQEVELADYENDLARGNDPE